FVIGQSCYCCRAWACALAKSCCLTWMILTGPTPASMSVVRAVENDHCRCRTMWERLSSSTFAKVVPLHLAVAYFCVRGRRGAGYTDLPAFRRSSVARLGELEFSPLATA